MLTLAFIWVVDIVPAYTVGVGLPVGVGNVGSAAVGRLVGLMGMILICDALPGSVLVSPNVV